MVMLLGPFDVHNLQDLPPAMINYKCNVEPIDINYGFELHTSDMQ